MNKIKDKVAVVTGASKGIGASIAKHFVAEGAKVVVIMLQAKKHHRLSVLNTVWISPKYPDFCML